jgi:hypothetical protein
MRGAAALGPAGGGLALLAGDEAGVDHRVDDEQRDQQQPRPDARQKQRDHRFLGDEAVDDHRDRGRDQDAERAARRQQPVDEALLVAAVDHLGDRHGADGGRRRDRGAGDGREDPAGEDRGHRQPARPVADPGMDRGEQVAPTPPFSRMLDISRNSGTASRMKPLSVESIALRRHQRREAAEDQHRQPEPAQREGHRHAAEQQAEQAARLRCLSFVLSARCGSSAPRRAAPVWISACTQKQPKPTGTEAPTQAGRSSSEPVVRPRTKLSHEDPPAIDRDDPADRGDHQHRERPR